MIKDFIKDIFTFSKSEKSVLTKKQKKYNLKFCLLAFMVPFAIVLFIAWLTEIAPFGNRNLMAIDAWGQYFPMLREMKRAFRSFNLSYSFSGALGFDLTAQSAYYTNSPLWYLLFLLPGELTPGQVDMMVFIRFALASLSFTYFLGEHQGKKNLGMVIFGTCYAFSGYTLAFINQLMWMDAVILLPLVLLGIERIYMGKSPVLYTVSLFLTIFTNFYIAYAVCIFAVLWFLFVSVTEFSGIRDWFIKAFRFGICSLTAGIINLPVLIPLLTAVSNTLASDMGFDKELTFYHSFTEMIMMLFPYRKSSLAFEAPNIYFGLIPAGLGIVALFSDAPLKKKLCFTGLLAFMFVSLNFTLLDYIWHGFHFPNQLPGRQSFLFIFLCLLVAYKGYETIVSQKFRSKSLRTVSVFLICSLVMFEITTNTAYKFASDTRMVSNESILRNTESMSVVTENYSPDYKKGEFWRTEITPHRYNGGQLHGYNGISHYSSTMSGDCYNFFMSLGMSRYAKNVSIEYTPNPVLNSLLGVRYIASSENKGDEMSTFISEAGSMYVYENTAVLPLFYVAENDVKNVDMTLTGHKLTNDIFKKAANTADVIMGNGEVNDDKVEGYFLNAEEFKKGIDNILESKTEITSIKNTKIKGTVESTKEGVLMISLPAKDVEIKIDGEKVDTLTIAGYLAGADITKGSHEIEIHLP